ncbi:glycosyl transferase family protein [Sulfitobacter donghicola]|uniref:Glycosyl transferase family 3 n=1 Tax=Sulfitobacter donghicola DSW-25 = KCTC 12864 = JCM 14565 TaxID=1300350 RepID=A0A073IG06_9RHOB|nr:glycosyl transferase family protein [Sulfitobacter donghicola]KEJ88699.1 glycosyl transferase family 3 [Sulfitobacter donghicola DSW-25 = KCTC 12864 = JCM 14565]KIN68473.1 Glycosyl transferase family, helical bundle domain protein [Sulfitobacter donghicola DSW-25 = KCTC 12864 = JCM 14565]
MTLAPFVRIVAQGKGRARSLTQGEATEAMGLILADKADPEAVGALLMVMRLRGETDEEIAGFTAALRESIAPLPKADLDWPCYAAGRTRGAPLFLLAAKVVALAGYTVVMHGWNSHQSASADLRAAIKEVGLEGGGLTYRPLETLSPAAFGLLRLREVLGLRSCINTVLRMWNPTAALASVQGVFHPSYRGLQSRAAALLGDRNLTVIKGGGGEFECNPAKDAFVFGLRNGVELNEVFPARIQETRRLHEPEKAVDLAALWAGFQTDSFAEVTVISTAALALWTLGAEETPIAAATLASEIWHNRHVHARRAG